MIFLLCRQVLKAKPSRSLSPLLKCFPPHMSRVAKRREEPLSGPCVIPPASAAEGNRVLESSLLSHEERCSSFYGEVQQFLSVPVPGCVGYRSQGQMLWRYCEALTIFCSKPFLSSVFLFQLFALSRPLVVFFFLIECIGVTLVNKITHVSTGAQFHNMSSVHGSVFTTPSQVSV